jgi:predicted dehydrogenase
MAEKKGLTLMVGHTFLFSEPVRVLRQLIDSAELGDLLYIYGQRLNLGVIREDLNALWNFGPHDLSILQYLLDEAPVRISARLFSVLNRRLEDVAFVVVEFPSGVVAHIHDSWLDPRKVRQFTVVGSHKMAVYDDTDHEGPLRIYDKGVRRAEGTDGDAVLLFGEASDPHEGFGEFKLDVRAGDMVVPRVVGREPLRTEIDHFVQCALTGAKPLTDGWHGTQIVAMLEAAHESARADGQAVVVVNPGAVVAQQSRFAR